ncbi:MAG: FAD-binding oxidoreductase [Deltaproteobacteria bacterium]|jgi:glycine/D-amino acid oxidase-like deaminating enzyme|nr:FAD-binding oxidoreductase [Deltaproteobacteria bacterium]
MLNPNTYDVVIIGGGIMGSATAYYLKHADETLKVAVVEMDPTYSKASTTLSLANARIQFSLEENIRISQFTFDVLAKFEEELAVDNHRPNISFRREGNLFLVDDKGKRAAKESISLQKNLGCQAEWWTPKKIKKRYPLYAPDHLAGGTFGPLDGHFDAYSFLMGYKAKARSWGAHYIHNQVTEILTAGARVAGVKLASGESLSAGYVLNCAGAWAAKIARTAHVKLPVAPINRQVFVLDTAVKPTGPLPLTILPSGLYFRTETGGRILLGKSLPEDPVGFDFSWDEKRFMEILWPELAEFVPAFDTLKLLRGWAGLYAVNTLDGNAILGEWPELKGLYLANGFSGHGLQQAPAVGRYLSELILNLPPKLDLSCFGAQRILENKPLSEKGLV